MKCRYCGAELNANELFCYRCGKAAEPEPIARHCAHCGAELEAEAAFCWKCGKAVRMTEQREDAKQSGQEAAASPSAGHTGKPDAADAEAKADRRARTEALVYAAQGGDSDSFSELYQLYYQKVFALAKTTVKSDADAEDVLQLTFLKVWNNLDKLKNPAAFSTWIQRITLNQCYSLLRKKHIDVSIDSDDENAEPVQLESDLLLPEVYAERSDLKVRLGKIIRELSAVQQQTISLYYFDELPVENIAWIMDCSVNTVKSRLFLARKSIKTEIEEQERKSGQPFYGIVGLGMIPFGKLFIGQMESTALPESAAAGILHTVTQQISGHAAGTAGKAAAAAKGGAKIGVKAAIKAAATAVSKKVIAGIVAGVLAVGAVTGGTVAAVSAVKKNRAETAQTQTVQETPGTSASGLIGQDLSTNPSAENDSHQQELQNAYRAYLDYLSEKKATLDAYVWQKNDWEDDSVDAKLSRPVAIRDIDGDGIAELLLCMPDEPVEPYISFIRLNIVAYRNGAAETVYADDGEEAYFHGEDDYRYYQLAGDCTLYKSYSYGDVDYPDTQYWIYRFVESSDGLYKIERLPSEQPPSEAQIAFELMSTMPASANSVAMTCDEAIAYLKGLLRENAATVDPSQQELQAAYRAYLDCLTEKKEGIDNYNWQKGYTVYLTDSGDPLPLTDDTLSRPVVLCDIYGDAIPELIYVGDADEGFYVSGGADFNDQYYNESVARLHIVTYRNGKAVTLFVDDWDYWDGECKREYNLFQINGNRELYVNTGDWEFYYYARFTEQPDGSLILSKILYEEDVFEDDNDYPTDYIYHGENGVVLSKEDFEYRKASMYSNRSALLMSSNTSWDEKNKAFIQAHGCPAMTCDEAIAWLKGLLNQSDATETQTTDNISYAEAYRAYRDHLIARKADIDNYIWQYRLYDFVWCDDYLELNDTPDDEPRPVSRPVVLYDIVGDSTPELIYICCNANARINYYNPSHLVILTYRNGQLITLLDCEWQHWSDCIPKFQIYASSLDAYKLQAHWSDGMTNWNEEIYDVFTEGPDGEIYHTHLLKHDSDYDEDNDQEINKYKQGDLDISREFYDYYVEKWEETKGKLLLYSCGEPNASYDAECGSMTCDEAIAYLDSLLQ